MPISISPELGFEIQPTYHTPAPKITPLSPEEIIQQLNGYSQPKGEISIPHPRWLIRHAVQSLKPPSPREAIQQLRKITSCSGFMF